MRISRFESAASEIAERLAGGEEIVVRALPGFTGLLLGGLHAFESLLGVLDRRVMLRLLGCRAGGFLRRGSLGGFLCRGWRFVVLRSWRIAGRSSFGLRRQSQLPGLQF